MDTIFALATPPGKSGVAVIRVSGVAAGKALAALGMTTLPAPRVATLAALSDATGAPIDKALVFYFPAPHSFTGEDVVELHTHGSRAVIARLLSVFSALPGLRPAEPGEFTRRAFLNGKMDLTAAEGLADLIDAETEAQRKQAYRHMKGDASRFFEGLRSSVLHALAFLEAYIDFPDEDIPESVTGEINEEIQYIINRIEKQLADKGVGEKIRDGISVAILGPPNVGKSSLMNLLAGRDVAIVSHIAGTTRDVIEVHMDIKGYSVILSDTAGIREEAGEIEEEGIRRSFARANEADIRIVVMDADSPLPAIETLMNEGAILLINKSDTALPSPLPQIAGITAIPLSVKNREGIDTLLIALEAKIALLQGGESSFITRARHRTHLGLALGHLRRYQAQSEAGIELRCEELRRAAAEIGKITGVIAVDELLGHIFASFCIGK